MSNLESVADAEAEPVAYVGIAVQEQTTHERNDTTNTRDRRRQFPADTGDRRRGFLRQLVLPIVAQSERYCQTRQLAV